MVRPEPYSLADHEQRARGDILSLIGKREPLKGELTLSDAIARGLTDNLDHRLSLMERALNETQLTLTQFDMLPKLAANAGYDWRDTPRASSSIGLETQEESLTSSYSDERIGNDASLSLSWSVLDFGLSYYRSKQQADRVLIAVETRRKVINNTTRQIIAAYYRAATADQLQPRVRKAIKEAERAIKTADQTQAEKLLPPDQMLIYKRDLLQNLIRLQNFEARLNASKQELAALINVPITQDITFAPIPKKKLPKVKASVEKLQEYGLVNRSELREEVYKERIERNNVNQQILQLFPALSLVTSYNYDSNRYLFYQNWHELGLKAAWNLLDVMKGPTALKLAESQVEYAQLRRLAVSTAIMAQVAISYYQYEEARNNYALAAQMRDIEGQILRNAKDAAQAETVSDLDVIRQKVASIGAEIEGGQQFAEAQSALAGVMTSIGYDLVPASIEATSKSRDELAEQIDIVISAIQAGEPIIKPLPSVPDAPKKISEKTSDKTVPAAPLKDNIKKEAVKPLDTTTKGNAAPKAAKPAPVVAEEKQSNKPAKKDMAKAVPAKEIDEEAELAKLMKLSKTAPKKPAAVKAPEVEAPEVKAPKEIDEKAELAKLTQLSKTPPKKPAPLKAPETKSSEVSAPEVKAPVIKPVEAVPVTAPKQVFKNPAVFEDDIVKPEPTKSTPPKPAPAMVKQAAPAMPAKAPEKVVTPPPPLASVPAITAPAKTSYVPPKLPDHLLNRAANSAGGMSETERLANQPQFIPGYQYHLAPPPGAENVRTVKE